MQKSKAIGIAFLFLSFLTVAVKAQKADLMNSKKTYVFIHGSWHSAWNWFRVTPILEKQGNKVYSIDLPAMGRDKTPVGEVRFDKTVKIICNLLDSINGKVILVGHSKNGVLISQVAEYRPDKIEKLVYLAAVLAQNGKCAADYFKLDTEEVLGAHITFDEKTQSSMLLPEIYKEGLYHDCDDEITEMAKVILSPEPRQTAYTPISITEKNYGRVPRYYIECTEDRAISISLQRKMFAEMPCRKIYSMATSHSPFFSKPKELCDILVEIASLQK